MIDTEGVKRSIGSRENLPRRFHEESRSKEQRTEVLFTEQVVKSDHDGHAAVALLQTYDVR